MDELVLLSQQLAEMPALTRVAAIRCATNPDYDGLAFWYPDGTTECRFAPLGSRRWLLRLFPGRSGQVLTWWDADFKMFTFHVSAHQDALKMWADSRLLCARNAGILR